MLVLYAARVHSNIYNNNNNNWGEPERAPHVRVVQRVRLYIYIYIYLSIVRFRPRGQFIPGAKWTRWPPFA